MRRKLAMMLDSYTVTVSGIPPLSTYKRRLLSLKAFGSTEATTPTPDAPVDIISNNGVLKARHQSGLPLGYTLVESIGFTGAQYINTGLAINNNTRVLFDVKRSTSSAQSNYPCLGAARDYVNNTNINKKTLEFSKSDSTRMYLQYATAGEITISVPDTTQRHTYDFDKNKLYVDENLIYTARQETFTGNAAFLIGTTYSHNSVSIASMFYGDVYGFKLWQDGTNLSMNLIPAKRNSDNVLGMYDLVSEQFFTNQGTGDFVAGDPVNDPVEIYTDGTVETINVHGKNLFDKNNANILSAFISGSGNVSASGINRLIYLQVEAGKTYYVSFTGNGGGRIAFFDNVPSIGSQGVSVRNFYRGGAITVPTGMSYFGFHFNTNSVSLNDMLNTIQIELGSMATEYEPYYDGGTATAEMLLKVGDYQDEQEILSGAVTRKVGVKVFDGTEDWVANTVSSGKLVFYVTKVSIGSDSTVLPNGSPNIKCSHFETSTAAAQSPYGTVWADVTSINFTAGDFCADLTAWKQWLADQYAAGTPVIVVYPLETPTTEQVAGQSMKFMKGNNTVDITQASLNNLELEVKAK